MVNQLKALGVTKEKEILLEKFCDILPSKWENLILVLRQGKTLHSHTLASLYGAFRFTEENKAERAVAEQDAKNHASTGTAMVQYSEPQGTALLSSESNESDSVKKMVAELMKTGITDYATHECDEDDNDDLVAMLAKTFNRFKAKSKRPGKPFASNTSVDKSDLACFKCGKKGHFMKECRSSQPSSSSSAPNHSIFQKSDDSYKAKYKKLKAHMALIGQESSNNSCMVADTEKWEDSDASSDDEEEVRDMCFMARENQGHVVKSDVESGRWVDIIMKKVSDFGDESNEELKLDLLVLIEADVNFVETVRSESLKMFEINVTELNASQARLKELKDIQLSLRSYQSMVAKLEVEKEELLTILAKEQKIIKSWMNSPRPDTAIKNTFDKQKIAYESGELHLASIITDLDALPKQLKPEITFQEIGKPKTETNQTKELSEGKSEASQTNASDKIAKTKNKKNQKKQSPQTSSQVPKNLKKKKNVSPSEPSTSDSGMVQVSKEESILLRLENQFQLLARQMQSCNARLKNVEGTPSNPQQNSKPFSKQQKNKNVQKEKKKVLPPVKPTVFVSSEIMTEIPFDPSVPHVPKKSETAKGESSEPIKRWVPKSN